MKCFCHINVHRLTHDNSCEIHVKILCHFNEEPWGVIKIVDFKKILV